MAVSVRLCSGRTAFEVTTNTKIDLIKAIDLLKPKVATKHILMLDYKGIEVSISSGRMIIKARSKEESLDIAHALLTQLGIRNQKHDKTLKQ